MYPSSLLKIQVATQHSLIVVWGTSSPEDDDVIDV